MDAQQARTSLDEVRERQRQVDERVAHRGSAWWYVGGIALLILSSALVGDLADQGIVPATVGFVVALAGLALVVGLVAALSRSMGMRPRRYPAQWVMWAIVPAFLVAYLGVGTALRAYDSPWDATGSALAGAVVLLMGNVVWRRAALRSVARSRATT